MNPTKSTYPLENKLLSKSPITDDEFKIIDCPKILTNFRSMYSRVMQNGSESWKALALLKEMRSQLTGFDFRIRLGDDKIPTALVWITYTMRKHLLQYGDVLFLDSQKRQYNKLCWPYIGPTIKTSENRIRVVAESVVLTEDLATYKWILLSLKQMEPKWDLNKIRIIFADGLITQNLLDQLKISETCTLRCDYWHLMNEVFPKEHNFGSITFALIKNYLKKMLLSDTEDLSVKQFQAPSCYGWKVPRSKLCSDCLSCLCPAPGSRHWSKAIINKSPSDKLEKRMLNDSMS